ncbi:MAG: hypothetical protein BKP49_03380 [Treponema sp. CETP13]|nr:MAG: hypothetical protein BKP49_03380 [Treponema sp. CETP13]
MKQSTCSMQKKEPLVLCADLGTSSIKTALITNTGAVLSFYRVPFNKANRSNRWYFALLEASKQLVGEIPSTSKYFIAAISISGNGPSIVNDNFSYIWNEPLSPVVTKKLENAAKQGNPCKSIFIPRFMHIQETMPKIWNTACNPNPDIPTANRLFSLPEYLVYQLTGNAHTSLPEERYVDAYWTPKSLIEFGLQTKNTQPKLPSFKTITKDFGHLTEKATKELSIPYSQPKIPVFCTGPDFIAALLGTANVQPGKICDRAGTSEGINLCTTIPFSDKTIRTLPSPISNLWNASCIIPDSGLRFSHQKHHDTKDPDYTKYVHSLLSKPKSTGYLLMKEIAHEIKENIDYLEKITIQNNLPFGKIQCTGGQSKNPEWMQFKATILNRPLHVPLCKDSELIGCAVVAFTALGYYNSITEAATSLVKEGTVYYPQKEKDL